MKIPLMPVLAVCVVLLSMTASGDTPRPQKIQPEEARSHVGEKVSVTFLVKKTKKSQKRPLIYLDSMEDYRNAKNLGVTITEVGMQKFKSEKMIDAPEEYFLGKTIRVVGTIVMEDDNPFIRVNDVWQIEVIEKAVSKQLEGSGVTLLVSFAANGKR